MSTLAALKDENFEANKATHLENVRKEWTVKGPMVEGVKIFRKIESALDEAFGEDRAESNRNRVVSILESLVHVETVTSEDQWWILRNGFADIHDTPRAKAVDETHNCCILTRVICGQKPKLAFQCQNSVPYVSYRNILASKSPFEYAVGLESDISAASFMLKSLKTYLDNQEPDEKILHDYVIGCQGFDEKGRAKFNPLSVSLKNSNLLLTKLLMNYDPAAATEDIINECLDKISKSTAQAQVRVLECVLSKRPDLKTQGTFYFATLTRRADLVELFFDPDLFTREAALTIIEHNEEDLWRLPRIKKAFVTYSRHEGSHHLLHQAVRYGCADIVDHLVEETDGAIQPDETGCYPLHYNTHGSEIVGTNRRSSDVSAGARSDPGRPEHLRPDKEAGHEVDHKRSASAGAATGGQPPADDPELLERRERIRKALVKKIIQKCEPSEIYKIAFACNETLGQISLDLKALNTSRFRFSDLVDSLTLPSIPQSDLRGKLKFEPFLRYVDIPTLPSRPQDLDKDHDDISRLLNWLSERKGVEQIEEIEILDRLWGSHSQKCISDFLAKFRVRIMNWRCQDFGLARLDPDVKNRLTSIHLYSSGNEAVEDHWFGPNGFETLQRLSSVRITVVEELMSAARAVEVEERLKALVVAYDEKLKALNVDHGERLHIPQIRVDRKRVYEGGERPPAHGLQQIGNLAIGELDAFLQSYRGIRKPQAVRVAILDNGIMLPDGYNIHTARAENPEGRENEGQPQDAHYSRSSIADRIVEGESFVHGSFGRLSSWLVASDPHGTQMANLICATDPGCEILVAKVGEHKNDVSPRAVEEAIRWAMRKKADVISMSFAIYQSTNALQKAIEDAFNDNIVLIASTHDEGSNANVAYPAGYLQTIAIAATNEWGSTLSYTPSEKNFTFRLKGVEVFAGAVPYLASEERVSGSSVATAIAAGLASLILSCHHISGFKEPGRTHWKTELVTHYMKEMIPSDAPAPKYVALKKFANLDQQTLITTVDAAKKIQTWFKQTQDLKDKPVSLSR